MAAVGAIIQGIKEGIKPLVKTAAKVVLKTAVKVAVKSKSVLKKLAISTGKYLIKKLPVLTKSWWKVGLKQWAKRIGRAVFKLMKEAFNTILDFLPSLFSGERNKSSKDLNISTEKSKYQDNIKKKFQVLDNRVLRSKIEDKIESHKFNEDRLNKDVDEIKDEIRVSRNNIHNILVTKENLINSGRSTLWIDAVYDQALLDYKLLNDKLSHTNHKLDTNKWSIVNLQDQLGKIDLDTYRLVNQLPVDDFTKKLEYGERTSSLWPILFNIAFVSLSTLWTNNLESDPPKEITDPENYEEDVDSDTDNDIPEFNYYFSNKADLNDERTKLLNGNVNSDLEALLNYDMPVPLLNAVSQWVTDTSVSMPTWGKMAFVIDEIRRAINESNKFIDQVGWVNGDKLGDFLIDFAIDTVTFTGSEFINFYRFKNGILNNPNSKLFIKKWLGFTPDYDLNSEEGQLRLLIDYLKALRARHKYSQDYILKLKEDQLSFLEGFELIGNDKDKLIFEATSDQASIKAWSLKPRLSKAGNVTFYTSSELSTGEQMEAHRRKIIADKYYKGILPDAGVFAMEDNKGNIIAINAASTEDKTYKGRIGKFLGKYNLGSSYIPGEQISTGITKGSRITVRVFDKEGKSLEAPKYLNRQFKPTSDEEGKYEEIPDEVITKTDNLIKLLICQLKYSTKTNYINHQDIPVD